MQVTVKIEPYGEKFRLVMVAPRYLEFDTEGAARHWISRNGHVERPAPLQFGTVLPPYMC